MFQKIVEVILPDGEKVRLESESARREGHLGFFKPNDNYLIEAAGNEQQELILYLWLKQKDVFRLFSVLTVDRYQNNSDGHDLMLVRIDGRFDPRACRE